MLTQKTPIPLHSLALKISAMVVIPIMAGHIGPQRRVSFFVGLVISAFVQHFIPPKGTVRLLLSIVLLAVILGVVGLFWR